MRRCIVALGLVVATSSLAAATTPEGPARLDGRWELDWDRSGSFEPAMEALEVSWFLRKLAGVARVGFEMRARPAKREGPTEGILVKQITPLSTSEVVVLLDGVARPGKDPTGRDTLDRYTWTSERGLEMIREFDLPSGAKARVREQRRLGDTPETLESVLTVWTDGVERASVRRVFRRMDD